MLHWNVFVEDYNRKRIEMMDIFKADYLTKAFKKILKKCNDNKDEFSEMIRHELMYWFWSKSEWEIVLTSWPETTNGFFQNRKVSVYDQIYMNWDAFVEYLWAHRKEL